MSRITKIFIIVFICTIFAFILSACTETKNNETEISTSNEVALEIKMTVKAENSEIRTDQDAAVEAIQGMSVVAYPTGWIIGEDWCENGTEVSVLYVPDHELVFKCDGKVIDTTNPKYPAIIEHDPNLAVIMFGDIQYQIPTSHLFVNLSQFLPNAITDITYAYSAPSDCAGQVIPGLTGCAVDGYMPADYDLYLDRAAFQVPCAYATYEKMLRAEAELSAQGYRLLIWDCYRPYRGSVFISDRFKEAYENNPVIQDSLGEWSMSWYAADGPSGHNFGTDIDLSLADEQGTPIAMPSHFDAFDDSAHLVDSPMNSSSISESSYTQAVSDNPACIALHRAFSNAGFSELASEWWHFGDEDTESQIKDIVGSGGLDFVA